VRRALVQDPSTPIEHAPVPPPPPGARARPAAVPTDPRGSGPPRPAAPAAFDRRPRLHRISHSVQQAAALGEFNIVVVAGS